jgi:hypothetical protein
MGARVPILLTSRSPGPEDRIASAALGAVWRPTRAPSRAASRQ